MRRVALASPYSASNGRTVAMNVDYARRCMKDSINRGEAPFASHLLYTQPGILDDTLADERAKGIEAFHSWMLRAEALVVYDDYGISQGMRDDILTARSFDLEIEMRQLGEGD